MKIMIQDLQVHLEGGSRQHLLWLNSLPIDYFCWICVNEDHDFFFFFHDLTNCIFRILGNHWHLVV